MSADGSPDHPPPPPPDPPKREDEAAAVTHEGGGAPADIVERHPADHSTSVRSPDARVSSQQPQSESGAVREADQASPTADQVLERWKQADAKVYADQLGRATPEQVTEMRDAAYREFDHTLEKMQATALKDDPESDQAWRDAFDRNQIAQQRLEMLGNKDSIGTPSANDGLPAGGADPADPKITDIERLPVENRYDSGIDASRPPGTTDAVGPPRDQPPGNDAPGDGGDQRNTSVIDLRPVQDIEPIHRPPDDGGRPPDQPPPASDAQDTGEGTARSTQDATPRPDRADAFDESRAPTDAPRAPDAADRIQELSRSEAQRLRAEAERSEPAITPTMDAAARDNGGELVGLDHRLKEEESLTRKIADNATESIDATANPERAVRAEAEDLNDTLRYTVQADTQSYMATYNGTRESLEAQRYELVKEKNTWAEPGSGDAGPYRAINTVWNSPEGQPFEVQFHTPESSAAKSDNHPLYEEYRDPATTPERAAELRAAMIERSDQIPVPPGALEDR